MRPGRPPVEPYPRAALPATGRVGRHHEGGRGSVSQPDVSTRFFGPRWDAPRVDNATPVGERCPHCEEPIEPDDRGLLMTVVGTDDAGNWTTESRPAHLECDLRSTLSHLYRQCPCYARHPSIRAEAQATLAAINARRRAGIHCEHPDHGDARPSRPHSVGREQTSRLITMTWLRPPSGNFGSNVTTRQPPSFMP
jgi:hypothetical protein